MATPLPDEENAAPSWERCQPGQFGRLASQLRRRRQRRVFLGDAAVLTTFAVAGGGLWLWLSGRNNVEPSFGGITCTEARQLAPAFARGELKGRQREQVRQHVAECPQCAERFREMGIST